MPRTKRFTPSPSLILLAASLTTAPARASAETLVSSPFRGVTHYQRTEPAGVVAPRLVVMHIVEIDLATPGISFLTTPGNGADPGEFTAQTTSQFVQQHNLQIGLNADFFTLVGTGPNGEIYRDVTNLAASNGSLISAWPVNPGTVRGALNISATNVPTLVRPASNSGGTFHSIPAFTPYNTIGGSDRMIDNGSIIVGSSGFPLEVHPRTVVGYNATKLFLFTVDGRQPGYSEGMNLLEIANVLKNDYGVTYALNLDGGGSTTMVMADPVSHVVNRPSDGRERFNGNNLGVYARLWPQWNVDVNGIWSSPGNWSDGVPDGVGQVARFMNTISSNRTVTVNAAVTLGAINFDSQKTYTIAGGTPTLTLDTAIGNAAINVASASPQVISAILRLNDATDLTVAANGTLTIAGPLGNTSSRTINKNGGGTLVISGGQTHGAGSIMNVNAGTLSMVSNAGTTSTANLTLNAKGGTTRLESKQNLNALNISNAGVASIAPGGANTLKTKTLTIADGGKFDLTNNAIVIDYSGSSPIGSANGGVYSGFTRMIQSRGIHSSHAATTAGLTTIAIGEAAELLGLRATDTTTWAGQPIDATTILVRYTYDGDANLDGIIDGGDYGLIDNNVQVPGAFGYARGDFNLDGVIDGGDYGIIDNNIQAQGAPFPTSALVDLPAVTAIPEPTACGFAVLIVAAALPRRGRSQRR